MATETGPDLAFARSQVEALMDDTCRVLRPAVLDPSALDSAPVVVEETRCLVGEASTGRGLEPDDDYLFQHRASLPVDEATDGIQENDVLEVLTSRRDPTLPGQLFVVRHVKRSTMLVSRALGLVRFGDTGASPDDWPEEVAP